MEQNAGLFTRRWPTYGLGYDRIRVALAEKLEANIKWGEVPILGFPSMAPHPLGLDVMSEFMARHTNAILTQTRGPGEKGFDGVHDIESDLISMVGHLLGATDVDGYVASGGTEANIMGLWIGREKLRKEVPLPNDRRVAVLASPASHYSLRKACNILDMGEGHWEECPQHCVDPMHGVKLMHHFVPASDGSGLHFVPCNGRGQIDVEELERRIKYLYSHHGIRRFIIFLNEGTTMTGAMDDVSGVGSLVSALRNQVGMGWDFYIHVDAAYGGFVYPFLLPDATWGFRVPEVDSMTADPYKMGQCPLAQGIFLCRKPSGDPYSHAGPQRFIQRKAGYVHGGCDDTLIGSRAGAYAAACWAVFMAEGFEGFSQMHRASAVMAAYLAEQIEQRIGLQCVQNLNMVAVYLPTNLPFEIWRGLDSDFVRKYFLMWDWFGTDPENPDSHPQKVMKFNITRDVQRSVVNRFIDELSILLQGREV